VRKENPYLDIWDFLPQSLPKTTGKEQETTKMTLHKIDDEYKLEYHFIRYDGSLGVMYQTIQTLYCIPVFFDTLAKAGGRILIKSCVKVSE